MEIRVEGLVLRNTPAQRDGKCDEQEKQPPALQNEEPYFVFRIFGVQRKENGGVCAAHTSRWVVDVIRRSSGHRRCNKFASHEVDAGKRKREACREYKRSGMVNVTRKVGCASATAASPSSHVDDDGGEDGASRSRASRISRPTSLGDSAPFVFPCAYG